MALRCHDNGRYGVVRHSVSPGRPAMYFGTIHALDRVDNVTWFCSAFDDSSTVMSAALFPRPTTRMRFPSRSSGFCGSM